MFLYYFVFQNILLKTGHLSRKMRISVRNVHFFIKKDAHFGEKCVTLQRFCYAKLHLSKVHNNKTK
jgi:hypothetical protein